MRTGGGRNLLCRNFGGHRFTDSSAVTLLPVMVWSLLMRRNYMAEIMVAEPSARAFERSTRQEAGR
jgi:hypothetical protein